MAGYYCNNFIFQIYCGKTPLSKLIHCPVIDLFVSELKYITKSATSFSMGNLPVAELIFLKSFKNLLIPILNAGESFFSKASTKPLVLIKTGQIAFTRIDLLPSS